jgi:Domain of unknown function (DUF222)
MVFSPPSAPVVALSEVIAEYCAHAESGAADALPADLMLLRAAINRLEVDFSHHAARFDAGYDEKTYYNPGAISWMRENCRMTSSAAATAVCVGEQVEQLDKSAAALRQGRIGFAHLGLLARTCAAISGSMSATAVFDETKLLAKAEYLSVPAFRTACLKVRHAADREAFLAQQLEEREWRTLTLAGGADGTVEVFRLLDREVGALLRAALDPLAEAAGPDDERSRECCYADALIELCAHRLDAGLIPQTASQRSHVQVTSPLETLLDLVGAPAAEVDRAGVVAGATVRRLACDSTITRVLLDARSAVVDVGRAERVVPGATRRALNVRDKGCRWPGCDRTASWTAAHHVVHWAQGGRTDLDNLVTR